MEGRDFGTISSRAARWATPGLAALLAAWAAACGGSDDTKAAPTATRTPAPVSTATATPTPRAGAVTGLIVVRGDVAAGARDALGAPPPSWAEQADAAAFDHALGSADWTVDGIATQQGVTAGDGSFAIGDLAPGRYTLRVSKTIKGNLLPLAIPLVVGDDGNADVVAEVALGMVRTAITYTQGGVLTREVRGPYGNWLITRDGRISELGDPGRVLTDADGDGRFEGGTCVDQVWTCGQDRNCGAERFCSCTSSCPFCDDCGPGVCVPPIRVTPYRCSPDDTCIQPNDQCICASSCPTCEDCAFKVCVPSCAPLEIASITVNGPSQLVVGRQGQAFASALLSDGSAFDVTYLADWASSDEAVATVDSWGTITGRGIGSTDLTARAGTIHSAPLSLAVVERPTLRRISLQNQSCSCGPVYLGQPVQMGDAFVPCLMGASPRTDILPVPSCGQVVQVGATLQFTAIGEFGDGSYEDITREVDWHVDPPEVGDVADGLFTARQAGSARLTASLGGVSSEATEIKVVTEPTLLSLSIYPSNWAYVAIAGGPVRPDGTVPCFDCGTSVTVLRGDELRFQATAHYDTGDWRDVTDQVTWRSGDTATATIDGHGVMTAQQGGAAVIDASLAGVTSNPVNVRVVNEATLQSISIYQEGTDRVVAKADQRFFHATGYYDIATISRDVTTEATWRSSDERVGGFDTPGVFTARAAGMVQVWAELGGQQSERLSLEVFETSELAYCDPARINRAVWADDFNRVVLESDCDTYTQPGLVTLRYTVTETQPHGGIFDPCLDLYVYDGDTRVRTIREEGCGDPFLAGAAPNRDEVALKYQLRAFWDLKDETGAPVPSGTYAIYGRFYLYYDPVVKIDVTVTAPGEPRPTRTPTPAAAAAVRIDSVGGAPGEQVGVGVSVHAPGVQVAGVQNDIVFDTRLPVDQTASGRPSCSANPAINKPQAAFSFLPSGCRPGVDCDGVRALVFATDNVDPIPDGAVLYTCTFSIPAGMPAGTYPLRCAGAVASDPDGQQLTARCIDGAIRVQEGGAPPPGPTDQVEGACYIGSSECRGSSYVATAQAKCCELFRFGALPEAISWCPGEQLDPSTGQCAVCASSPCAGLPASGAPGDASNQPALRLSSLDERCGDQTGAAIVSSVRPEYDVTLRRLGSEIDLPSALPLTMRLAYRDGEITCYPAVLAPPGSRRPDILEQVGVVMDMRFLTEGGAFAEQFATEIKGRDGYVSFSYVTTPDKLQGTYRPDLPGYQDVGVGLWGNFGGDQTNGGVAQYGIPPGRVSEYIPVAQWATWFDEQS